MLLKQTLVPTIQQSVSYFQCPHKILSADRREFTMSVPLPLQSPTDFLAYSMEKKQSMQDQGLHL